MSWLIWRQHRLAGLSALLLLLGVAFPLVELLVRPHFQPELQLTVRPSTIKNSILTGGNWILDTGMQDASSRHLSDNEVRVGQPAWLASSSTCLTIPPTMSRPASQNFGSVMSMPTLRTASSGALEPP